MSRPENQMPAELFYNEDEAKKYTSCSRIIDIQSQMAERALELLNLQEDNCILLDIGCGSGLSGEMISEEGHFWIGMDISRPMLEVAVEREVEGDLYEFDMGQGFSFRAGVFDGAISISALQWLCVAAKKSHNPFKRLLAFFQSLYTSLRTGARAVLQFYPENKDQLEMITNAAMKASFAGSLIVDYPHSAKAKKMYLVLTAGDPGGSYNIVTTTGREREEEDVGNEEEKVAVLKSSSKNIRKIGYERKGKPKVKSREWIEKKKERQKRQGKEVRPTSKYTGRTRSGPHF
eukprot:TRINITY_DN4748_c0_g2_i3.p2 TRINITY_DN4748_c0_g2~~TRINITY_DN4748_c0_g2_i3.p2  ORF type:complete len:290 (-),score=79.88 TRINITY_DN4748_c0_g2_i3:1348-2217(-)